MLTEAFALVLVIVWEEGRRSNSYIAAYLEHTAPRSKLCGVPEDEGPDKQGRVHGFPEKIALELAFKGKWKFPEAQRGCGEDVSKNVRPLQGN